MRNWYATVPYERNRHLYISHFIFANQTGGGWIINVHRYCLNRCLARLDEWISEVATTHHDLRRMAMRPSGQNWDRFWRIFTSSKTITFGWGLRNDATAIWNTFRIKLIGTKSEQCFLPEPNPDGLLEYQMQCVDLQKIDGHGPMPKLAGYIGDSKAKSKPVDMKLTYAAICHVNCGQERRMTGMALSQNVIEQDGEGTDEHLLEIFHAVKDLPYLQAAPR